MEVDFAIVQDVGQRRDQQDSGAACALTGTAGFMLTVADGLGGHVAGGEASHIATEAITEAAKSGVFAVASERGGSLLNVVETANQRIRAAARAHGPKATMGTTFVAALLADDGLSWISVGDSHLYLMRNGQMAKLNADHSQAGLMLQSGRYREGDPEVEQYRSLLRSALTGSTIEHTDRVDTGVALQGGDLVLLASDGLNTIDRRTIESIVAKANGASARTIAESLIEAVRRAAKSGQDNTTVVVGRVTKVDNKPARSEGATEIATAIASRRPAQFDLQTVPATGRARHGLDDGAIDAPPSVPRHAPSPSPINAGPLSPTALPPASPEPVIEHRTNWQLWAMLGAASVIGIVGGILASGRSPAPPIPVNQGQPAPGQRPVFAPVQPVTAPPPAPNLPKPPVQTAPPQPTRPKDAVSNVPNDLQPPVPAPVPDGTQQQRVLAPPQPPAQVGGQPPGVVTDPNQGQPPAPVVDPSQQPQPRSVQPFFDKTGPGIQRNNRNGTFSPRTGP